MGRFETREDFGEPIHPIEKPSALRASCLVLLAMILFAALRGRDAVREAQRHREHARRQARDAGRDRYWRRRHARNSIHIQPGIVQSGKVTLRVHNAGSITHEMVLVRATSSCCAADREGGRRCAVGVVDEEAISEADKMGETGDVKAGTSVTKTFDLTPGNYVVFCNIDTKNGATVLNHFTHGMVAPLVVV